MDHAKQMWAGNIAFTLAKFQMTFHAIIPYNYVDELNEPSSTKDIAQRSVTFFAPIGVWEANIGKRKLM